MTSLTVSLEGSWCNLGRIISLCQSRSPGNSNLYSGFSDSSHCLRCASHRVRRLEAPVSAELETPRIICDDGIAQQRNSVFLALLGTTRNFGRAGVHPQRDQTSIHLHSGSADLETEVDSGSSHCRRPDWLRRCDRHVIFKPHHAATGSGISRNMVRNGHLCHGLGNVLTLGFGATAFAYLIYFRLLADAGAVNASFVTLCVLGGRVLRGNRQPYTQGRRQEAAPCRYFIGQQP